MEVLQFLIMLKGPNMISTNHLLDYIRHVLFKSNMLIRLITTIDLPQADSKAIDITTPIVWLAFNDLSKAFSTLHTRKRSDPMPIARLVFPELAEVMLSIIWY